jgi:mRNA interferase MazF
MTTRLGLARGDIVLVVFPFTDLTSTKLRPALIVGRVTGDDVIQAFMTSQLPANHGIADCVLLPADPGFAATGLRGPALVRLDKLVTLHRSLIRRRLGHIGKAAEVRVAVSLRHVFEL